MDTRNTRAVFDKYYNVFGERMCYPFEPPSDFSFEDFLDHVQKCIDTGMPFDHDAYFGEMPDDIII